MSAGEAVGLSGLSGLSESLDARYGKLYDSSSTLPRTFYSVGQSQNYQSGSLDTRFQKLKGTDGGKKRKPSSKLPDVPKIERPTRSRARRAAEIEKMGLESLEALLQVIDMPRVPKRRRKKPVVSASNGSFWDNGDDDDMMAAPPVTT